MNAPRAPRPIATTRIGYPFKDKQGGEIADPRTFIEALIPVQGGHYLLGAHGFFHGGIHLDRACKTLLSIEDGIGCVADGEVVAYRIDGDYHDATPGAIGNGVTLRPYSTGFVLVRHRLQAPSPPMPAKPAPMATPGADIRDWGTRLYADPQGRQEVAWLRHGTPLIVEVGPYAPGNGSLVRVVDTGDSNLPREGWISRTHLALDPAVGTGLRGAFGMKDVVTTSVYRGDSIDPDKSAAHAQNRAQRERPDPPSAPVLTLYSLYMHVASEQDYSRNAKWKRPPWWPERDGTRKPEATDRVVALAQPVPIRQGELIGYLGEDVPARAHPFAGQPVSRRLLHLELFSGDDVPAYLTGSRRWAKEHLPDSERTLLLLMPGDTLQRDAGGPVTVNQRQILRAAGLESRTVEGKRWRKVTLGLAQGQATGWIEEDGRRVSPWEWPGFEVQDEVASPDGFRHQDPEGFAAYLRGEGPRPPDTPFYQALRALVDRDHDGEFSEQELDRLLRDRHHADRITRLIVRHESQWTRASMQDQSATVRRIAAKLGPMAVENVSAEEPRGEKLPWWEDVAAGVEGFPTSSRVWHFHPGGVAGNFSRVVLTVDMLKQVFDARLRSAGEMRALEDKLASFADEINQHIRAYKLDSNLRLSHFFAQVREEAGASARTVESLDHTPSSLIANFSYFRRHPDEAETFGRTPSHPADQQAIANRAYSNRVCHGAPSLGQGWKYRGRGLKQLTWQCNYEDFQRLYQTIWQDETPDFVSNPDLLAEPKYAVRSAIYFWLRHELFDIADKGPSAANVNAITKVINKDTNSYEARENHFNRLWSAGVFSAFG